MFTATSVCVLCFVLLHANGHFSHVVLRVHCNSPFFKYIPTHSNQGTKRAFYWCMLLSNQFITCQFYKLSYHRFKAIKWKICCVTYILWHKYIIIVLLQRLRRYLESNARKFLWICVVKVQKRKQTAINWTRPYKFVPNPDRLYRTSEH